jgi:hypothetical protein
MKDEALSVQVEPCHRHHWIIENVLIADQELGESVKGEYSFMIELVHFVEELL